MISSMQHKVYEKRRAKPASFVGVFLNMVVTSSHAETDKDGVSQDSLMKTPSGITMDPKMIVFDSIL